MKQLLILLIFLETLAITLCASDSQQNVIIVMADDLGWNDVSYHGSSEIPTYNIDALAYHGVILNNFRTAPVCTPSRTALLTAKYPHRVGMQTLVINGDEPWGLPTNEKIMPEYFNEAGYVSRLVGKWHLGLYQEKYTPMRRGYESFFGYLNGAIDYFDHTFWMASRNYPHGYDFRRDLNITREGEQTYATDLFTAEAVKIIKTHDKIKPLFLQVNHLAPHAGNPDKPMQAKSEDLERFSYIADEKRRYLAAMIYQLDLGVGEIMKALKDNEMLDNSIVVFYSDNGGPTSGVHSTKASNYPLRGQKYSVWEGAIRTHGIIFSSSLPRGVVRNQMIYNGDLLPTLAKLSGNKFVFETKIDGLDQTDVIISNADAVRKEFISVDDTYGYSSYIYKDYKIVNGTTQGGLYNEHLGVNTNNNHESGSYYQNVANSAAALAINSLPSTKPLREKKLLSLRSSLQVKCTNLKKKKPCDLANGPCLFNLKEDPCEENNLIDDRRCLFDQLTKRFNERMTEIVPTRWRPSDPAADPKNFGNCWNWWQADSDFDF